jgi:soluble lytic murein transglycosylase-like protein
MGAPQIIWIVLVAIGLGLHLSKDGEHKPEKWSFYRSLIRVLFRGGLLWWGGFFSTACAADIPDAALRHRAELTRTARAEWGLDAPVATFAAQIHQESGWRENVTASDNGRGLAQFMDATASWLVGRYPALGSADPYNPAWAMRALTRYDRHLYDSVRGADACQRMGAALKGYNAGVGYVLRAQARSPQPEIWFGVTEHIATGQSAKNFEYSRLYPRWIIHRHQPRYVAAGFAQGVCA